MKRPILAGVAVVLVMALTGSAMAQQGLYFSEDYNSDGLYSLSTTTGAATHLGSSGVTSATVGLAPTESMTELFGSSWTRLHRMRTDGSGYADLGEAYAEALGYDSTTDTLYGMLNSSFFTLDPLGGGQVSSLPNPTGLDFEGLAFDEGRDVLWAIPGYADSDTWVWTYTPSTQTWTEVYDTGVDWIECGLAYNPFDDVLYAKSSGDATLYQIDLGTGLTSRIGSTGLTTGGGLAYVVPEPASLVLLAVAGLLVTRRR